MIIIALSIAMLLTLSAFFAGAETALTAVSKPLMHQLEQDGDKRAATVTRLLDKRARLISTLLFGNILVNILASALTTQAMIETFGDRGVVYATAIMTLLIVVYGEILPKTYALLHPTQMSLFIAGVTSVLVALFHPFNVAVEFFVNGALRLFGVSTTRKRTADRILAELRGTIDLHMGEASVKEEIKHERAMLRSVLDLADIPVSRVMNHRKNVVTIDADLPIAEIIEQVAASRYSRIPLWREQPDNIVGIIHAKALLRALESAHGRTDRMDVVALALPPWFIPDTTTLLDQLNAFRSRREHFALVVDEYGTMLGALTLEDILEEIVGEIRDEHEIPVPGLRPQTDGSYLIDGSVALRELNRELDWDLPDETAATVAGLMIHESRIIPEPGQKFLFYGYRFEVVRRNRNQLTLIRVTPPKRDVLPQQAPPHVAA